uniref:Uncharacterized protein n=1 Tax=Glossina austeni TaxID=7395 RepID=A0A1A9UEG1_GLOAU
MTMWQSGGMGGGGHGSQNNPWMKLMGIVHKERRHTDNITSQSGSNERNLNQRNFWCRLFHVNMSKSQLIIYIGRSGPFFQLIVDKVGSNLKILRLRFKGFLRLERKLSLSEKIIIAYFFQIVRLELLCPQKCQLFYLTYFRFNNAKAVRPALYRPA